MVQRRYHYQLLDGFRVQMDKPLDKDRRIGQVVASEVKMADQSRDSLFEFLDYLSKKGLMAKGTVSARKAACTQILGILEGEEVSDVLALDLDQVVQRFQNLHGKKYTPQSLLTYKSRVKGALDDFASYNASPLAFRPSVQPRDRIKAKGGGVAIAAIDADSVGAKMAYSVSTKAGSPAMASSNIMPIPLRPDLTVYIQGLPFDLSQQEARKIAAVVTAMAPGSD